MENKSNEKGSINFIIPTAVIALIASIYAVIEVIALNEEIDYLNKRIESMENSMNRVDSLTSHIGYLCIKLDSINSIKPKPTPSPITTSYKSTHYSNKHLPSELIVVDGWTSVCGTIYTPSLDQCLSTEVTASGREIDEMIKDSLFYCVAITRALRKNGFKIHDTIELQYMNKYGEWTNLVNQNGDVMKGYVEDSMGRRLNDFYCIDLLMSKEQMNNAPFDGLTKFRIRKY